MTNTELLKRVRVLSTQAKALHNLPQARVEVGLRMLPLRSSTLPTTTEVPGDDLYEVESLTVAANRHLQEGEVVHLYLSTPGMRGELKATVKGWVGTSTEGPTLLP